MCGLLAGFGALGCGRQAKIQFDIGGKPLSVRMVQPPVRTIVRVVGQPSFIESFERTSIFPKPTAYVQKWIVDIGDKVKKGDVLATLFAPELVEELKTKKAAVVLDQERIDLARKQVDVAAADVKAAQAGVKETEELLNRFEAEVVRWDTEVKRLKARVPPSRSMPGFSSNRTISSCRPRRRGTRPWRPSRERRPSSSMPRPLWRRPRSVSGSRKPT